MSPLYWTHGSIKIILPPRSNEISRNIEPDTGILDTYREFCHWQYLAMERGINGRHLALEHWERSLPPQFRDRGFVAGDVPPGTPQSLGKSTTAWVGKQGELIDALRKGGRLTNRVVSRFEILAILRAAVRPDRGAG